MATADEAIAMLQEVLMLVRADSDPIPASIGMYFGRAEELRNEADRIEKRDAIIYRARKLVKDHNP